MVDDGGSHGPRSGTERVHGLTRVRLDAATLLVIQGALQGTALRLGSGVLTIGAGPACQLRLSDRGISRKHAQIELRDGQYVVRDLGSMNGTFLNQRQVGEATLAPGDVLGFGDCLLRFEPRPEEELVPPSTLDRFGEVYGRDIVMRQIFGVLERVATTDSTVLITGETGTGKDLLARSIHAASRRANGPFLVFDCSAISPDLLPSELFGHVEGAFTGATRSRPGLFEAASAGTVFIDEIGELPLELQPKLLRVLESREVRPLGGNRAVPVNVRVVAATHRDMLAMKQRGAFREDLFFRLAVVAVDLPPLRERRGDVPGLAAALLSSMVTGTACAISKEALDVLAMQAWPGNVRELRNVLERSLALAGEATIEVRNLMLGTRPSAGAADTALSGTTLDDIEREVIRRVLMRTRGAQQEAARLLGIHRDTLRRKLKRYGLA